MPTEFINLISSDEEDEGAANNPVDLTGDDEEASSSNTSSHHNNRALHGVNQHTIQRRSLSTRSVLNLLRRCLECSYLFTRNDPPLSQRRSLDMCTGCFLLNAQIVRHNENPNDVKHWLCTGEIPMNDWDNKIDNSREEPSVKRRAREMRERFMVQRNKGNTSPSYGQHLPTEEDLLNLLINQGSKCAVVGWLCHFGYYCQKSWSLSIDHIAPISTAPAGMNPWVLSNIQVMCRLLNQIKGNHSDLEVRRWFKTWKDANIHNY